MNASRKSAIAVGVLFVVGTLAGVLSVIVSSPIQNAEDILAAVSGDEYRVVLGAAAVLVMGLALAMVPVVMFPILRRHSESLAIGYVVFRGGIESITYVATAVSWLLLLPLSQLYAESGFVDASNLRAVGSILLDARGIGHITSIVFPLGAMMFYYLLYRTGLVPRWLAGWGLIGSILYLATGSLGLFDVISPGSTLELVLFLPLALQEMVLAVWLIVRGFN
jgi:hypothetical protein